MEKPYSPACDRNRDPILKVLAIQFADRRHVLEVGSGTGQHAVYFAKAMAHLQWQTSDVAENLSGINAWLQEAALSNTLPPLVLDAEGSWPKLQVDAVFSANTLHIMSWPQVEQLFANLPRVLTHNAAVAIYGPFNYDGRFTSESNAAFNASLQARGAHMGIRDFSAVNELASGIGLHLCEDVAMPANNRLLLWRRN